MKVYTITLLILCSVANAAGDGQGSVTDLMWPFINFVILFSFLFFKLRKPVVDGYISLSQEIEEKVNSAHVAEKEAAEYLKNQEEYKKSASGKLKEISEEFGSSWEKQKKIMDSEYSQKVEKLYSDYENKLNSERRKVEARLSSELLENIIEKTSSSISASPEKKSSAMRKFLQ